jgi:hypothetical protein
MGKRGKKGAEPTDRKGKRIREPFMFLGQTFEFIDKPTVKKHLFYLILISIAVKLLVLVATTAVFHSFIDLFDIGYYLQNAVLLTQGQIPYLNFSFDYPPLAFIPIGIALIPALATQNAMAFVYSFQLLMVLCDIGTLVCVYFIGLRVGNEKTAFSAGLIYATAFSAAYFVLTKYDAFPTLLLMGAVLFTVYGMGIRGYISATLGFFAKIFPAIAFPFMILYNAKTTSLREEIISTAKVVVPFFVILLLPFLIVRPDAINTYLFATGASVGVYVNTATYTLYTYVHDIAHLGLTSATISLFMYLIMGLVLILLLWIAFKAPAKRSLTLLKLLACALFAFVFFTKFHSPQYIVWYTPFLALLVADDLLKIGLFYLTQALAYIEFPLMFNTYYVNLQYTNPVGSGGWYLTLVFFTLENLVLIILFYIVLRPKEGLMAALKNYYPDVIRRK